MVNKSSNAGHQPQRTCVICKQKAAKQQMLRFIVLSGTYVIDYKQRLKARGQYLCNNNECINHLEKWLAKRLKRKAK